MATDVRSVPDRLLDALLYPVAGWGVLYGVLYFLGRDAFAIPLLFPLALWQAALTIGWGLAMVRQVRRGALAPDEVHAGARSIGGIVASDALLPAVVFLVADPLSPTAHGTAIGIGVVSGLAYALVVLGGRIGNRYLDVAVLTVACLALPINTTGAVTMASMAGWFDQVAAPAASALDRAR